MQKKIIKIGTMILILSMMVGCGSNDTEDYSDADKEVQTTEIVQSVQDKVIYWISASGEELVQVPYEPQEDGVLPQVEELIGALQKKTNKTQDYTSVFQDKVEISSYSVDNKQLYIHFTNTYLEMNNDQEILARVGIARTLLQIEGIDYISFYVNDLPLQDASGKMVGTMNVDRFMDDMKIDDNLVAVSTIYLFYPTTDGKSLAEVERRIRSTTNKSKEKLVVEALMKDPGDDSMMGVIPEGTTLLSVSTLDGVCLVNFDSGFEKQNYAIDEGVVIYSIVNSLCSLPNVNKVQISIEGSTTGVYRKDYKLEDSYSRNLDFLEGATTTEKGD